MLNIHKKRTSPLKNAARLRKIVAVFANHGFQNLVEKAKLGKFLLTKITSFSYQDLSIPERLRLCFEQLGPTFIKLGQLLASRPDLLPEEFTQEFKKLHDQVAPISFVQTETVLRQHFGEDWESHFSYFNRESLAAASIAQVYQATLKNGTEVVIKVQRPGIQAIIKEDLGILYTLAELLDRYVPETRVYNPVGIVNEFAKALELETNFVVEANNIRRFEENFSEDENIKIPHVYSNLSGKRLIVMEALNGIPLSQKKALKQEGIDPEVVLKTGLYCYLKMVFTHGLFHGDLHAGNIFVLPDSKIGLVDFGMVGRLDDRTKDAIAGMLIALANEDYERLAYEYVDMAPFNETMELDRFAREIRDVIAPYYGLTSRYVNVGKLLMDSTGVAARYQLSLPSELILFFKSIVSIEGMGHIISDDFDFLSHSIDFASELVKTRYEPQRMVKDLTKVGRDYNSLLASFPRQLQQFLRRINSPDFSMKININEITLLKKSVEKASNIVFLGIVIGSLLLSSSILMSLSNNPALYGIPYLSVIGFGLAGFLSFLAFINYIRK